MSKEKGVCELNVRPTSQLASEIDDSVAKALADCGARGTWRSYTGRHQSELVASLEAISGCAHVGLASSGTAALEMLLRACRLEPGDEVLIAGYDYPGTFAAIERVGGRPALVDVAKTGWNLCWESLEATVTPACRVLIASHLHGQLQPIEQLEQWCAARGICLIQDACQALGASIEGKPLGHFGDATIFSFGGSKTISAGRGGAWAARNPKLAQRTRLAAGVGSGTCEMSELQAAVVAAQLPFLERITECCRAFFTQVCTELDNRQSTLSAPWFDARTHTAFYQAGWMLPDAAEHETTLHASDSGQETARQHSAHSAPHAASEATLGASLPGMLESAVGSPLIGLSQSQHAEWQRVGIGSGFQGYHRRSTRRCRVHAPLQNTARAARATLTVHHRAALLHWPSAEALAHILDRSAGRTG